ncbi:MAG TPA: helix-turn-helix transcriptional regulator [bacterium]|nr:helix-turn-helix transcriptional regulator [bacterium]
MDFLGDRIRYLRESAGLKQKDMALEFSLNENTWSQYETNKRTPDIDTIKKNCRVFSCFYRVFNGINRCAI